MTQQAAADEKGGCALGVAFVITSTNKEDLLGVGLRSIFWSGYISNTAQVGGKCAGNPDAKSN